MRFADLATQSEAFAGLDHLPDDAAFLLEATAGLFGKRLWWETVVAAAMPDDATPCFLLIRRFGQPVALFPLLRWRRGAGPDGAPLGGLTTPYTCLYAPLLASGLTPDDVAACMRAFARFCRPAGLIRLDAMSADWPCWDALQSAARGAGLLPLPFDHFGNWHETIGPGGWAEYLAGRPGALRETVRRRLRRAEAFAHARFVLVRGAAEAAADGIAAFESVYARSWKQSEPFPHFNARLIGACAAAGTLRLGLWFLGDTAVAAQFWVLEDGQATVLKLAHDETFKAHSPGTVLTALMLRHLLDREAVTEIDFGRGDDAYKRGWAGTRRQRVGVLLANPLHPAGASALLRHTLGRGRAALLGKWLPHRVSRASPKNDGAA